VRILVTGAAGMLGRDLVAHLEPRHQVVGCDIEVDITNAAVISAFVEGVRPKGIIHCAAWTDVDGAEADEAGAHRLNAEGTRNVAKAAARVDAALVVVSTDYVFDGSSSSPYTEDSPTAPIGVYGRTKLAGEQYAMTAHPGGTRIVRTAWLYGSQGRNFVDTMRGLGATRDEVTVVADQVGSPTWTKELAPALEAALAHPPGVYHATGSGSVSWAGFAEAVFQEAAISCRVAPTTTAAFGRPAPRPAHSTLANTKPDFPTLRPWRDALRYYLRENPTL
jgi:dTDP-4-dehydrorhamnose reductase